MCLHRWKRCSQDGTPTGPTEGCKVLSAWYMLLMVLGAWFWQCCGYLLLVVMFLQANSSFGVAVCPFNLLQPFELSNLLAHAQLFVSVFCANKECADAVCRLKASDLLQKQEDLAAKVSTKHWPLYCLLSRSILSNIPLMKTKFSQMLARF